MRSRWQEVVPAGAGLPGFGFELVAYGYGAISAVLILYLNDSGLGGASVGLVVFAAAFLATRTVGSPTVDRYGGATVAIVVLWSRSPASSCWLPSTPWPPR